MVSVATVDPWQHAWQVQLAGQAATQQWAECLGALLPAGSVLALVGELGAGKTTFVQGLAVGLGVHELSEVLSPTYTLVNEYPGVRATLVHVDLYRLQDEESAVALGIDEALSRRDAVAAVEWANHLPELLPAHAVWIRLTRTSPTERTCEVAGMARPSGL